MAGVGILFTPPRLGISVAASAKLYAYEPGTTTLRSTYTTSALSVANANPLVADSAGLFAAVYIDPALGYKFVLKTSADVEIWSQDNAYLPSAYLDPQICQGRLTLESGVPVTVNDNGAKTTIYFTPYGGNRIALYNTTKAAWELYSFTERSLALTGFAADTNFDLFLYDNAGTLTLEQTAWSSATARATAITLQDGVYVKSGSLNKRYLGTFRTTGTIGQTEDSTAKRYVWNYYHRMRRALRILESTDSWTYTTATYRQANNSAANQVDLVVGVAEVLLSLSVRALVSNSAGGAINGAVAIGEDGLSPVSGLLLQNPELSVASRIFASSAHLDKHPAIGRHYYPWIEYSTASGTTTWQGDDGAPTIKQSGMSGYIEG